MPIVTFSDADLRDPNESLETLITVEGPIDRDENGDCYCSPLRTNPWDNEPELYAEVVRELAEHWGESREAVAAFVRNHHLVVPANRPRRHMHLKVSGRAPEASPRYYELPLSPEEDDLLARG